MKANIDQQKSPFLSAAPLRDGLLVFGVISILSILSTFLLYSQMLTFLRAEFSEGNLRIAQAAATHIQPVIHETLESPVQESSPEYLAMAGSLRKMMQSIRNVKFIYTAVLRDGVPHIVVDASPKGDLDGDGVEDHAMIMTPYPEADLALTKALMTAKATVSDRPYRDRWGTFVSAYQPFFLPNGDLGGVVGVDMSSDYIEEEVRDAQKVAVLGLVPTLLVGAILGIVVYLARNRVYLIQRTLKRSESRLKTVIQTAVDGVIILDRRGSIESLNPAAKKIFGCKSDHILGKDISLLLPELNEELKGGESATASVWWASLSSGERGEATARHQDGHTFPAQLSVSSFQVGEEKGYTMILRDISSRRKQEEELFKARVQAEMGVRTKTEFLANMSHEVRTPLNAIIGFCDLMKESPLNELQRDYVDSISSSGHALLDIVTDILDFSMLESGRRKLQIGNINLESIVDSVIKIANSRLESSRGVTITKNYKARAPKEFGGDAGAIRQILLSLVTNAVKFTERGRVDVTVDLDPQGRVMVFVKDTGIGIAREIQRTIFDSFVQGDMSTTRKYGGVGLGLSLAKGLVSLMGGTLELKSEIGSGTEVCVFFNLQETCDSIPMDLQALSGIEVLKGKRVLVVDDNPQGRFLLSTFCRHAGMHVLHDSRTSADALEWMAITTTLPDIIISDIMRPEMDGFEFAAELSKNVSWKHIRKVAASSEYAPDTESRALRAGYDLFLPKPIGAAQFVSSLAGLFHRDARVEESLMHRRVLVVEDNSVNRKLIKILLDKMGCDTVLRENGAEALTALQSEAFDLCLMDLHMPVMGGIEATREIRGRYGKELPILAVTASYTRESIQEAFDAGMNDFVPKPIHPELLRNKLLQWMPSRLTSGH